MKMKRKYMSPAILKKVLLEGDTPILAASAVDNTTIKSTGQETQNWNYENGFDHNWGE